MGRIVARRGIYYARRGIYYSGVCWETKRERTGQRQHPVWHPISYCQLSRMSKKYVWLCQRRRRVRCPENCGSCEKFHDTTSHGCFSPLELSAKSNSKQGRARGSTSTERSVNKGPELRKQRDPFWNRRPVAVLCFHYPSESREHGRQTLVPGLRSAGTVLQTK